MGCDEDPIRVRIVLPLSLRVAKLVGLYDLALDQLDKDFSETPRGLIAFDCNHSSADGTL